MLLRTPRRELLRIVAGPQPHVYTPRYTCTSTSMSQEEAESFAGDDGALVKINTLRVGSQARDISWASDFEYEMEVVFLPNTGFEVVSVGKTLDGRPMIELNEIADTKFVPQLEIISNDLN